MTARYISSSKAVCAASTAASSSTGWFRILPPRFDFPLLRPLLDLLRAEHPKYPPLGLPGAEGLHLTADDVRDEIPERHAVVAVEFRGGGDREVLEERLALTELFGGDGDGGVHGGLLRKKGYHRGHGGHREKGLAGDDRVSRNLARRTKRRRPSRSGSCEFISTEAKKSSFRPFFLPMNHECGSSRDPSPPALFLCSPCPLWWIFPEFYTVVFGKETLPGKNFPIRIPSPPYRFFSATSRYRLTAPSASGGQV